MAIGMTAAALCLILAAAPLAEAGEGEPECAFIDTVSFPLEAGRLHMARVARHLLGEMGVAPAMLAAGSPVALDVGSPGVRLSLLALELASEGALQFDFSDDALTVQIDQVEISRNIRQVKKRVRQVVAALYPEMAAGAWGGLQRLEQAGPSPLRREALRGRIVLLVHGLDSRASI